MNQKSIQTNESLQKKGMSEITLKMLKVPSQLTTGWVHTWHQGTKVIRHRGAGTHKWQMHLHPKTYLTPRKGFGSSAELT